MNPSKRSARLRQLMKATNEGWFIDRPVEASGGAIMQDKHTHIVWRAVILSWLGRCLGIPGMVITRRYTGPLAHQQI